MGYHTSLYVFVFLPVCLVVYQLMPAKWRWKALLFFSYLFFYLLSGKLLVYLVGATALTHYIGAWMSWQRAQEAEELSGADRETKKSIKLKYRRRCRSALAVGILLLIGVLAYLKYYNFFISNVSGVLLWLSLPFSPGEKSLLMPVGISFYTLQAIGYMADVYWGKAKAENRFGRMALFLGFFPQIMEGPICRYSDTAGSLFAGAPLTAENLSQGYMRIFWGLFKKKVVADRLAVIVGVIFGNYTEYGGAYIAVAAVAYTVQLYMEFSGCMDIVIGSGKLFGVCLPENFRQPFCARSASEFWRRWHITLGTWFKSYIFYPVSVSGIVKRWNQFGRKHAGKYLTRLVTSAAALFPVWLCNGLWHGARWSYIFYGMYYFVLIMLGTAVQPARNKLLSVCHIREDSGYWRVIQIAKTWVIIFVGELFFRADGLQAGFHMFASMFRDFQLSLLWDGSLLGLGLGRADLAAVAVGCVVVAVIGSLKERGEPIFVRLVKTSVPVRWGAYYALILAVIVFAAYGDGYQSVDLIYAGF